MRMGKPGGLEETSRAYHARWANRGSCNPRWGCFRVGRSQGRPSQTRAHPCILISEGRGTAAKDPPSGRGACVAVATTAQAEAREHVRMPLSGRPTSSEPSVCPGFTRFELEQLPEPFGGRKPLTCSYHKAEPNQRASSHHEPVDCLSRSGCLQSHHRVPLPRSALYHLQRRGGLCAVRQTHGLRGALPGGV